jgi:signal peptide peptidase SppA
MPTALDCDQPTGDVLAVFDAVPLADVPYLGEWITNWAIYEPAAQQLALAVSTLDIAAHLQNQQTRLDALAARRSEDKAAKPYTIDANGIATIALNGPLMKQASSFQAGTSTVLARRALRQAANDPEVEGIMLRLDSPGGTVAGTYDLADDVWAVGNKKPVHGYIEDLAASACYAVGSQVARLTANRNALVGSIGTYAAVRDYSQMFAREGVKVHVVRAGAAKGAGVPGTEITADQLAEIQTEINALQEQFDATVARGRKMNLEQVKQLADGRVHVGVAAQQLGLLDGVESVDAAYSSLVQKVKQRMSQSSVPSADAGTIVTLAEPLKPLAASLPDLKAACPGASADFLMEQIENNATLEQAQKAFITRLNSRMEELAKAPVTPAKKPGVAPLAATNAGTETVAESTDPVAEWDRQVNASAPKHGNDVRAAARALAKANPELYASYCDAYTQTHREKRK